MHCGARLRSSLDSPRQYSSHAHDGDEAFTALMRQPEAIAAIGISIGNLPFGFAPKSVEERG